jgi:hypothetical protein
VFANATIEPWAFKSRSLLERIWSVCKPAVQIVMHVISNDVLIALPTGISRKLRRVGPT